MSESPAGRLKRTGQPKKKKIIEYHAIGHLMIQNKQTHQKLRTVKAKHELYLDCNANHNNRVQETGYKVEGI